MSKTFGYMQIGDHTWKVRDLDSDWCEKHTFFWSSKEEIKKQLREAAKAYAPKRERIKMIHMEN